MISFYYVWFDYWTLNEKLQKRRTILSQSTNYLHKWLVHLNFDMSNAAMLFFLRDSQLCVSLEQHPISFDGLSHLDWHFVEVSHHAYRAG